MIDKSISYVLDRLNQAHLIYYAKLLASRFSTKIVYTDHDLNQKILDFGTLFSSFNFPIVIESERSDDYYSIFAMKDYLEALRKARKEKSYDRAIDQAVKDAYVYMEHLIKVCDYINKFYVDAFKKSVSIFNEAFGFRIIFPKQLPKMFLHIAYFDPEKKNTPVRYNKEMNVFDVYPVIFKIKNKYYSSLFAREIAKLLVNDPVYLARIDDLRTILKNVEWLQNFKDVFINDVKLFFRFYLKRLEMIKERVPNFSRVIDVHTSKLNSSVLNITSSDYKRNESFSKAVNIFLNVLEKEERFLKVFAVKSNDVEAYLLKNKLKSLLEYKEVLKSFSKTLLSYDEQALLVIRYYLDRFYPVFLAIYTLEYRVPSLHLERYKDKNLKQVCEFYKKRKEEWKDLFVTTAALENLNKVAKGVYSFHKFLTSLTS